MNKIEAVRNMQTFIENNLEKKISPNDLSKGSFYSPGHSYRIFIEILNMSPSDHIRKLKLSESALELRDNKVKITDVAFKCGYDSVEGYQRGFYKEFGTNPYEYSKNPIPICLFRPCKKHDDKKKTFMKDADYIFISIVQKPKRKVIIKRGIKADNYMDYCHEVG